MDTFVTITRDYEHWFAQHSPSIVRKDLELKHKNMSLSTFLFFRATFYDWILRYYEHSPELIENTPVVLAVGDLHVENFGTWRDSVAGRLCWGCNDVDEAYPLPYTNDLVRLAVSAKLAIGENGLHLTTKEACAAILEGYVDMLKEGGRGFVLAEEHPELRAMAINKLREPSLFWTKLKQQLTSCTVPSDALAALEGEMPDATLKYRFGQRTAGQGSLGRPRFVAMADFCGGLVAREAKIALPSACIFGGLAGEHRLYYNEIIAHAFRSRDPYVGVHGKWVVRSLSPDNSRIELSDLPRDRDEHLLLRAMGAETANIHLGTKGAAKAILADMKRRNPKWLRKAVKKMTAIVREDQRAWASHYNDLHKKKKKN